ncbi:MAG: hypothetical protein EOM54_10345 [Clostridia bacterium]|nr:hypothetical protein [Clostridia bacterium]
MNAEQIYKDAEYCEQIAAEYRRGVKDKTVAAACEINARRFDRLAAYARRAAYPPQREIVELRDKLTEVTAERDALKKEAERKREPAWPPFT